MNNEGGTYRQKGQLVVASSTLRGRRCCCGAADHLLSTFQLLFPATAAAAGADVAIVRRTQSALSAAGEPAVHFSARFAAPSTPTMLRFVVYGALMMTLAKWGWGRALLLK